MSEKIDWINDWKKYLERFTGKNYWKNDWETSGKNPRKMTTKNDWQTD